MVEPEHGRGRTPACAFVSISDQSTREVVKRRAIEKKGGGQHSIKPFTFQTHERQNNRIHPEQLHLSRFQRPAKSSFTGDLQFKPPDLQMTGLPATLLDPNTAVKQASLRDTDACIGAYWYLVHTYYYTCSSIQMGYVYASLECLTLLRQTAVSFWVGDSPLKF